MTAFSQRFMQINGNCSALSSSLIELAFFQPIHSYLNEWRPAGEIGREVRRRISFLNEILPEQPGPR